MKKLLKIVAVVLILLVVGLSKSDNDLIDKIKVVKPETITFLDDELWFVDCQKEVKIEYTIFPEPSFFYKPYFYSDNEDVALFKDGRLIIKGPGTCNIYITAGQAKASKQVIVEHSPYYAPKEKIVDIPGLTYVDGILIANKSYSLPSTYNPNGILDYVNKAFNDMAGDAKKQEDINLFILSGFRPYDGQKRLYERYAKNDGYDKADTYSARPGHSEHQTGLAMDVNEINYQFDETKEGKWLKENCMYYGFIIRYQKGKEPITGYIYEPWHIRYVGTELAIKITKSGLSLEEYLGIDSKYNEKYVPSK